MTTYTPSHAANFMLVHAFREERLVTQMKLQKLVYIGYGWMLALLNKQLFDEPIYAWKHGPVVKSLYNEFKHYRARPIDELSLDFDLDTHDIYHPLIPKGDEDVNLVLNKVWGVYKDFGAGALRNYTHQAGSPWDKTYRPEERDSVIPDNLIKDYFESKITEYLNNARQAA